MPPRRRKGSRSRRRRSAISKPVLLGAVGTVAITLLLGFVFLVWPLLSGLLGSGDPKSALSNTEILIDRSIPMDESFWGGKSKLEFAQQVIGDRLLSRASNNNASWAIRQFGGPCNGDNTSLVVPFAPGNIAEAQTALAEVQLRGETSFTQGMTAAIEDLADPELFGGKINHILSIVGTAQFCSDESVAATLNARMAESNTRIYVSIIGLGVPVEDRKALIIIAKAMRGKVYFAGNGVEMDQALNEIRGVLGQVMTEFKEGDGFFLQTPVPVPTPPPPTSVPTVDAASAAKPPEKPAGEPAPTVAPTQQPPVQATQVPAPEPTASPTPEPTLEPTPVPTPVPTTGPTATPVPTATPTPVPTPPLAIPTRQPTARPPVTISNDTEPLPAKPADCLSAFQPTPPETSGQTLPHVFAGTISIDGVIAPNGAVVTARIDGLLAAVAVSQQGNYTLAVEPPLGVSYIGKKVIFSVGECQASPTAIWQTARVDRVDLSVTSPQ